MAMTTREIIVLDPTVSPLPVQASMAPRPSTLNGLTVGLLANGKRNADRLLDHVAGLLTERYQLNKVVTWDKGNSSRPCPDELMREIMEQCDVVVTATGD